MEDDESAEREQGEEGSMCLLGRQRCVMRQSPVKYQNRVLEYVRGGGERRMAGLEHVMRECKNRNTETFLSWPSLERNS